MKRLLAIALLLLTPVSAMAQSSKSAIISDINGDFADNTAGAITAALLRSVTTEIVSSYVDWITCTASGGLVMWNVTTPTCLTKGTVGQVLSTQSVTPVWENLASKISAGSNILITGTITPTIALSPTVTITSLALGGATIGTNVLAATGTANISGSLTLPSITMPNSGATAFQIFQQNGTTTNVLIDQLNGVTWLGKDNTSINLANNTAFVDVAGKLKVGFASQIGWSATNNAQTGTLDLILTRGGAAALQFGAADAASPVAQTLQFQNGSGSNIAGVNATIIAPLATGTGTNGDLIFQTGTKTISSSTTGIKTTAMTIKGETQAVIISGTVTSGANGATGGQLTLNGSTSGSVAIKAAAIAGAATVFQLPNTNSISGNVLATDGAGGTSWVAAAGTGTVQSVTCGNALTCSTNPITVSGTITPTFTTSSQYVANTTTQTTLLDPSSVWASAVMTVLTPPAPGGTVTPDFGTGYNFSLSVTGNVVIGNPTNRKIGQSGCIYITMGSTTGTVTVPQTTPRVWMFAGGTQPTATVSANSKDRMCYQVGPNSFIYATYENTFQ